MLEALIANNMKSDQTAPLEQSDRGFIVFASMIKVFCSIGIYAADVISGHKFFSHTRTVKNTVQASVLSLLEE